MMTNSQRRFLHHANALAITGALGASVRVSAAQSASNEGIPMDGVKALVFDVFGTLVWPTINFEEDETPSIGVRCANCLRLDMTNNHRAAAEPKGA